ncbi:MAG: UDP-N-acetylmuramoyl-L-alanyl-D-glutamate--2,6-diaminopimelate ligase [Bryobacterales bacterium]|nr:UDP-N-acetylmuramoyl-L-alanyl-D-glutamate--2,6-diaminopimelate ligase [Bryobacterales bacterium]
MKLERVIQPELLAEPLSQAVASLDVSGLEYDSRAVTPGSLFFAFAGANVDGRRFSQQAMERGAVAVVSELTAPEGFAGPWVRVTHGRKALGMACRNRFGAPEEHVALSGVTGTNGKTTTAFLIDALQRHAGETTALLGTIGNWIAGEFEASANTTPESVDLYKVLAKLRAAGGRRATMEVSSHALALCRAYGVPYHTAVFTNLSQDHLDFHRGGMEEYFRAKHLLFEENGAAAPRWAAINLDDEYGRRIVPAAGTKVLTYGLKPGACLRAENIETSFDGLRFRMVYDGRAVSMRSPMVGEINVYNILAAAAAGITYGMELEMIAEAVAEFRAVPGRFERVDAGQPFLVIVDYAHTPDALRNAIQAARSLKPGRVITLFGCGGDRDRGKRPLMGMAAAEMSDFVVLTSDNPRSEDPLGIINDALVGLRRLDTPHIVEADRARAIRMAIGETRAGDCLLIAGKGHENYQVLRERTVHFDDREIAAAVLEELGYRKRKG